MGLLKNLAKKRKDLKIIIYPPPSTLSGFKNILAYEQMLQRLFFKKVAGRTHPVKVFYTQESEPDYMEPAMRTVLMIHRGEDPGDILLEEENDYACRKLKLEADDLVNQGPNSIGPLVCIPFCSSLPPRRFIELCVVDPGSSEQKVYNSCIRVDSLLRSPTLKAYAQQRAGRALNNIVLELVKLGIKDLVKFDYVDTPAPEALMRALELLNCLTALDDEGNHTPLQWLHYD